MASANRAVRGALREREEELEVESRGCILKVEPFFSSEDATLDMMIAISLEQRIVWATIDDMGNNVTIMLLEDSAPGRKTLKDDNDDR